ncbi:50S ribosomal protein L15 [Buchnera aphidicola]|uniref:50S ribosomal protein L15 n=1 Tax=Buchnera aphidicola TaxID=9 RepID=UPI0031B6CF97
MNLNSFILSIKKKNKKRVGRGIGSGLGKTSGRGHKGQKSRSGGKIRRGFEGGQTPLYRRIPKFGFVSKKKKSTIEVKLSQLLNVEENSLINISFLKKKKIIKQNIKFVKIIKSYFFKKKIIIEDLKITKGAKELFEACGGKIKNSNIV